MDVLVSRMKAVGFILVQMGGAMTASGLSGPDDHAHCDLRSATRIHAGTTTTVPVQFAPSEVPVSPCNGEVTVLFTLFTLDCTPIATRRETLPFDHSDDPLCRSDAA